VDTHVLHNFEDTCISFNQSSETRPPTPELTYFAHLRHFVLPCIASQTRTHTVHRHCKQSYS
jgi:hypothetical protein